MENETNTNESATEKGGDRTARLGLFPSEIEGIEDVERRSNQELIAIARDGTAMLIEKDSAIWNLVHRRAMESNAALLEVASNDPNPRIRRSASWGLFKLGLFAELRESPSVSDSGNVKAWKDSLIFESLGSTGRFDHRPIRKNRKCHVCCNHAPEH